MRGEEKDQLELFIVSCSRAEQISKQRNIGQKRYTCVGVAGRVNNKSADYDCLSVLNDQACLGLAITDNR